MNLTKQARRYKIQKAMQLTCNQTLIVYLLVGKLYCRKVYLLVGKPLSAESLLIGW